MKKWKHRVKYRTKMIPSFGLFQKKTVNICITGKNSVNSLRQCRTSKSYYMSTDGYHFSLMTSGFRPQFYDVNKNMFESDIILFTAKSLSPNVKEKMLINELVNLITQYSLETGKYIAVAVYGTDEEGMLTNITDVLDKSIFIKSENLFYNQLFVDKRDKNDVFSFYLTPYFTNLHEKIKSFREKSYEYDKTRTFENCSICKNIKHNSNKCGFCNSYDRGVRWNCGHVCKKGIQEIAYFCNRKRCRGELTIIEKVCCPNIIKKDHSTFNLSTMKCNIHKLPIIMKKLHYCPKEENSFELLNKLQAEVYSLLASNSELNKSNSLF